MTVVIAYSRTNMRENLHIYATSNLLFTESVGQVLLIGSIIKLHFIQKYQNYLRLQAEEFFFCLPFRVLLARK